MLNYFRTPPGYRIRTRIMWIVGGVCLLFLLLFLLLYAAIGAQADAAPGSDAAERWEAEDSPHPFAQLSAFFSSSASLDLNDIYLARTEIGKALEQNAVSAPEGASSYIDAFSGETSVTVSSSRKNLPVTATVCGGDFFFFHSFPLVHGNYFSEDTPNTDTVILDEVAAWQLFGATEVAGMEVTIGGQPYTVIGVTALPTDPIEKLAYGDEPRIFLNLIGYRVTSDFDKITWYEIVMTNLIDNFAAGILEKQFRITETSETAVLYDYTQRFSFETLALASPDYFLRTMRTDGIIPPYWENVALVAENKAIVIAFFAAIFGILATICFVAFVSLWFVIHPIRIRAVYAFIDGKIEARRMKRWLKKQNSPLFTPERKKEK